MLYFFKIIVLSISILSFNGICGPVSDDYISNNDYYFAVQDSFGEIREVGNCQNSYNHENVVCFYIISILTILPIICELNNVSREFNCIRRIIKYKQQYARSDTSGNKEHLFDFR